MNHSGAFSILQLPNSETCTLYVIIHQLRSHYGGNERPLDSNRREEMLANPGGGGEGAFRSSVHGLLAMVEPGEVSTGSNQISPSARAAKRKAGDDHTDTGIVYNEGNADSEVEHVVTLRSVACQLDGLAESI